ncbi:MAG: MSCRAMM family adhesin SdrC [Deltaproteobacteria bacterium]|nr:MSCRAMM family adhesin SdrC [Deltaproteobacteria bacterium]
MYRKGFSTLALMLLVGCSTSFGGEFGDGKNDGKWANIDSDNDGISDMHEDRGFKYDADEDGIPDYKDTDSDNDCIPDAAEAGDSDLSTPPRDVDGDGTPDYRDLDTDGDGLPDADEDSNCNGVLDGAETSNLSQDTDEDGATDLVEVAAGTDGVDPADNPQANGDFVFVMPYQANPSPREDDLDFATELKAVDLYVLVDRSGSMSDEISSIRNNMDSVVRNLTCAPAGNGQPGECIQELWSGLGSYTYYGRNPFIHHLDVQSNPGAIRNVMPGADTGNCDSSGCTEPHLEAVFSAASGQGSGLCQGLASYSGRFSCNDSPAGSGGVGYPCFRPEALPVILLATDEPFTNNSCAGVQGAAGAAFQIGAKVIGIRGNSNENNAVINDLSQLAGLTGAIDAGGNPLVFAGANSGAASAIEDAVRTVTNNLPLAIGGVAVDEPGDDVNAVESFVDHIETLQVDSPECSTGLEASDSDGDGYADVFTAVVAGTPLCWRVVPKVNETVTVDKPTLYRAKLDVYADGVTLLDSRNIFFVVPPTLYVAE